MKKAAHLEFKSQTAKTVSVAGDFNDWCGSSKGAFDPNRGSMEHKGKGKWVFSVSHLAPGSHSYKFIVDGHWEGGSNRTFTLDSKGNLFDPTGGIVSVTVENPYLVRVKLSNLVKLPRSLNDLQFSLLPKGKIVLKTLHEGKGGEGDTIDLECRELDFSQNLKLEVIGIDPERAVSRPLLLDGIFRTAFISEKPLGPRVEGNPPQTVFRIFSPRARKVVLKRFEDHQMKRPLGEVQGLKDTDGVWEMRIPGTHWGTFYGFTIDGPTGEGEGFNPKKIWPDPYARAGVYHTGLSLLKDMTQPTDLFKGWTDQNYTTPKMEDLVIWEASVRDLTSHVSSKVEAGERGKFAGLRKTAVLGSGIDHMKALGINAVEFLPIFEFDDEPPGSYHWGYMTSLYFAPDAWYGTSPFGAQVDECKSLIDTLHGKDIAVVLDVVYNHTGEPHVFMGADRKYFHRHDGNLSLLNFSGCGNDFKSENPMARRMIIDSLEFWVREYHVDGFRFDLAELLDLETLHQIEKRLRAIKPDIILIAEPWSFRGTLKGQLKGTSWTSWNDDFRNRVKEGAAGKGKSHELAEVLTGSMNLWTANPLESVNYVESHDNYTLIDHLTTQAGHDGSHPTPLDIQRDLLCAAATLLSPGIPMIAQGQEMLRSKRGNENSYNAGDAVNAVDYSLREKFPDVFAFYQGLIQFRLSDGGRLLRTVNMADVGTEVFYSHHVAGVAILRKEVTDSKHQLLLLFNFDQSKPARFHLKLPAGTWCRRIGSGKAFPPGSISMRELRVSRSEQENVALDVPPIGVEAWVLKK